MHSKGANARKISSFSAQNGELFQWIHGGVH
jgi:hypothetical protein